MPDRPPSGTSVTSLAFLPGDNKHFFSCGAADGAIKLWDLRAVTKGFCASSACLETAVPGMERREGCMDSRRGLACLDVNAATGKLLASSTDSTIYIYDARRMEWGHEKVLSGHTQTSFYIRAAFSPCGQFVASGSADSRAYVWDLNSYSLGGVIEPMFELDGHRGGDCSVVDWCKANSGKLATCSDDSTVKVWRATPGLRAGPVRAPADSLFNGARRYGRPDAGEKKKIKRGGCASRRLKNSDIRTFFKTVPQTVSG